VRLALRRLSVVLLLAGCIEQGPLEPSVSDENAVALVPATLFLQPGASVTVAATQALLDGGPLSWKSSEAAVASVSAQGSITALTLGTTEVRASNARGTGRTRVTVLPAVAPVQSWRIARQGLTSATLLGLWNVDSQTGFAVGQAGTILRSEDGGTSWERLAAPDSSDLVGVWGTSPSNAYAVGTGGTILHYDGTAWSRMNSPTHNTLLEVWGLAPDDIYVVGAGVALHYDGTTWQVLSGVDGAELWAVWGTDQGHLFAAGQNGVLYRLEGTHWSRLTSPTQLLLLGIWGSGPDNIYAVGIQGTVLHWDGVLWSPITVPTSADLFAVWGRSGGEILAVGDGGTMLLFNGSAWTLLPQSATRENLRAVHAAPLGNFVATGWNGTAVRRRTTGSWLLGSAAPLLFDLASGPGDTRYAVGGNGAVLRNIGGLWTTLDVERSQSLYGAARDNGELVVVGDAGTIRRYNGVGWTDESFGARLLLRSIWMDGSGAGFIVGEQGIVLRRGGAGGRWVEAPRETDRFLRHVFGLNASDVYAVGDSGTVLHWNGSAWRLMAVPTDTLLRGVWGSGPSDVFAVGAGGTILRYDGERWYRMSSPTQVELRAVWGTGPTEVYAVGEFGVVLRFDGARWRRMTSPTRNLLLGFEGRVGGTPTVVGAQGLVLEGER
jgi:photosystem II stability/assembly factor-like uncharacterized protein